MSDSPIDEQRANDKVLWNRKLVNKFLQIMVSVKARNGMWAAGKFSHSGWDEVFSNFHAQTGRRYNKNQLQGKYQRLRKAWLVMYWIIMDNSGVRWDPTHSMFVTTEEQWQRIIQPPLTDAEERDLKMRHRQSTQRLPFEHIKDSDDSPVEIDCSQPITQAAGSSGSKRRESYNIGDIPNLSSKSIRCSQLRLRQEGGTQVQSQHSTEVSPRVGTDIEDCMGVLNNIEGLSHEAYSMAAKSFQDETWRKI